MRKTKPPPRNLEAQCPQCGNQKLYHDYWDECFACGRGIEGRTDVDLANYAEGESR